VEVLAYQQRAMNRISAAMNIAKDATAQEHALQKNTSIMSTTAILAGSATFLSNFFGRPAVTCVGVCNHRSIIAGEKDRLDSSKQHKRKLIKRVFLRSSSISPASAASPAGAAGGSMSDMFLGTANAPSGEGYRGFTAASSPVSGKYQHHHHHQQQQHFFPSSPESGDGAEHQQRSQPQPQPASTTSPDPSFPDFGLIDAFHAWDMFRVSMSAARHHSLLTECHKVIHEMKKCSHHIGASAGNKLRRGRGGRNDSSSSSSSDDSNRVPSSEEDDDSDTGSDGASASGSDAANGFSRRSSKSKRAKSASTSRRRQLRAANIDAKSNELRLLWEQVVLWLESGFYSLDVGQMV